MRIPTFTSARRRLAPFAALAVATVLGGCVAYTGYPSGYYGYNYPSGYYPGNRTAYAFPSNYNGYPSSYANSYYQRPAYSQEYNGSYTNGGAGGGN